MMIHILLVRTQKYAYVMVCFSTYVFSTSWDFFPTFPGGHRTREELCNIDYYLNKDLHKAVDFHVRYTHSLHKLNPKKFSIATSRKVTSAYLRILGPIDDVTPSSKRIICETHDLLTLIDYIMKTKG